MAWTSTGAATEFVLPRRLRDALAELNYDIESLTVAIYHCPTRPLRGRVEAALVPG